MINQLPFSRLTFADSNTLVQQFGHVREEFHEVRRALQEFEQGDGAVEHLAEELGDLMTSCFTALCIVQREYGIYPLDVLVRVGVKNSLRGYDA